jgi:hypothetical protein
VTDDAGANLGLAVDAAGAHGSDTVDELGLADVPRLLGARGAHHGASLHEHRGDDVMPAAGVGQQLIEQVAPAGAVPQMVVRIDNGEAGLEDRLPAPIKPVLTDRKIGRGGGCGRGGGHRRLLWRYAGKKA